MFPKEFVLLFHEFYWPPLKFPERCLDRLLALLSCAGKLNAKYGLATLCYPMNKVVFTEFAGRFGPVS